MDVAANVATAVLLATFASKSTLRHTVSRDAYERTFDALQANENALA